MTQNTKQKIAFEQYAKSADWLSRAKSIIPSASQTYSKGYRYYSEGAAPVFLDRGQGAHVWDIDGNEFIDTVLGLGAITIGYNDSRVNSAIEKQLKKGISFSLATTLEVELAEKLIQIIPCAGMVRFGKNGSDVTSAAVRLARAFTGRDLILTSGYHGWHDWSIAHTDNNRGIPKDIQKLTLTFPYNDLGALEKIFAENKGRIAGIVMEPVQLELPKKDYLQAVKNLVQKNGALLIFDEVVTGFRVAFDGAQGFFGVVPDLACFGKGMGNGAAISALVGKSEIITLIDQGVFFSMTGAGETLSIAAALETIRILEEPASFSHIRNVERKLVDGVNKLIQSFHLQKVAYTCQLPAHTALLFRDSNENQAIDFQSLFQQEVMKKGILYLGIHNFCLAHQDRDIEKILAAYEYGLAQVKLVCDGSKQLSELLECEKIRPVFKRN